MNIFDIKNKVNELVTKFDSIKSAPVTEDNYNIEGQVYDDLVDLLGIISNTKFDLNVIPVALDLLRNQIKPLALNIMAYEERRMNELKGEYQIQLDIMEAERAKQAFDNGEQIAFNDFMNGEAPVQLDQMVDNTIDNVEQQAQEQAQTQQAPQLSGPVKVLSNPNVHAVPGMYGSGNAV